MDLFLIDPEDLPFEDRMKIKGAWPDKVSIADIAKACYPDDAKTKKMLIKNIVELCKSGKLQCYGDIKGWEWGEILYSDDSFSSTEVSKNPYPGTSGTSLSSGDLIQDFMSNRNKWRATALNCLIEKSEFNRYLQSVEKSPIGYLANWFKDTEQQIEAVGDAVTGNHAGTESKPLNQIDNEFKSSGLLNIPIREDAWFEVIDVMTKDYYLQHNGSMPSKAQAWVKLCKEPPNDYGITISNDNQSLVMTGVIKPFNKRSFDRRWKTYTAKSNHIEPN